MDGANLSIERLAWLAARDEVQRLTRPPFLMRILGVSGRSPLTGNVFFYAGHADEAREHGADKRAAYAFAVDDAVALLSVDERRTLRQTGQLPPWFMTEVRRLVRGS